nr:MAG TPA: hypothetical protein [Bacteriophage sp.]
MELSLLFLFLILFAIAVVFITILFNKLGEDFNSFLEAKFPNVEE